MCTKDKTKISKEEIERIISDKLPSYENSVLNYIKFEENGRIIDYTLTKLYKMCNKFQFGLIKRVDNGDEFLVTLDSIRKMCIYGYINNIYIEEKPDTGKDVIKHHTNKLKADKSIKPFEVESYSANEGDETLELLCRLSKEYDCLYNVDNEDIRPISWLRLVPYGFIFDLGRHVCAVKVRDELGAEQVLEINKFNEMQTPRYNEGKFSPRSGHKNFCRVLDYIDIYVEDYNSIKESFGISSLRNFYLHESGKYYRGRVQDLTLTLTSQITSEDNMPYEIELAIPKPEKFDTKSIFESALREAKALEDTRFNDRDYVIVNPLNVDTSVIMNMLLNEYYDLQDGDYYKEHKDIADYVFKKYRKFREIDEEITTRKIIGIINSYNNGESIDYDLKMLGIFVPDETTGNRYTRLATIYEAAELFGVEYLIKCDNTAKEDNTEQVCAEVSEDEPVSDEKSDVDNVDNVDNVEYEDNTVTVVENTLEEKDETENIKNDAVVNNTYTVIDTITLADNTENRIEVRKEGDTVYTSIIINGVTGRVEGSEQSEYSYIFEGLNKGAIRNTLTRALAFLELHNDVESIMEKLK